jgi:predicted HD phosphohydrolase
MGLLLHELGHLYGAEGELEADKKAMELFGIKVWREDHPKYGEWLETI